MWNQGQLVGILVGSIVGGVIFVVAVVLITMKCYKDSLELMKTSPGAANVTNNTRHNTP